MFDCIGTCVDLAGDPVNCGGCGVSCEHGEICVGGTCTFECQEGYMLCSNVCRDLRSDQYNCGTCGIACSEGFVCEAGSCVPDCPEGYTVCGGVCRDVQNNPSHCGECDNACNPGEVCHLGACTFACPDPYIDCSGSCADLSTDHMNCGTCGSACGAGEVCSGGTCTTSCYEGLTMCSGVCVDRMRDPANCGSCGRACATGEFCYDGDCTTACPGGFTDCSGICRDLMNDRANCGACDSECDVGLVCDAGSCAPTCEAPLVVCGGTCSDVASDPENCGGCGTACGLREACVSGTCEPVILLGPSLTEVTGTVATQHTFMSTSPYTDKHDGGMVYSIAENAIYAFYGNDLTGRNVYRIDHNASTSTLVATLTYNRHGSHPVIDDAGGYIYFPPSQYTSQLERMDVGGSHSVVVLTAAPSSGTFAHGTWKNGKLWIVLNDYTLHSYDPIADSWASHISIGAWSMVIAHANDSSDNIYIWGTSTTGFRSYDTITGTSTTLASFPVTASLGGNGQIEYIPSAEGLIYGFIYAVSGCTGSPRLYSIRDNAWYVLTDPHDNGNCNGHCTYDSLAMRLYVTDATNRVWYYQY